MKLISFPKKHQVGGPPCEPHRVPHAAPAMVQDKEGTWVRLDHEVSSQLLVAWYCGEQLLDYSFQAPGTAGGLGLIWWICAQCAVLGFGKASSVAILAQAIQSILVEHSELNAHHS